MFENQWRKDMNEEEAVKLCSDAILAGIFNDLGSGSNVDVCVITPEKVNLSYVYISLPSNIIISKKITNTT